MLIATVVVIWVASAEVTQVLFLSLDSKSEICIVILFCVAIMGYSFIL